MIKIKENRLFTLEETGEWIPFAKRVGYMHSDCLKDYCKMKGLKITLSIPEIIRNTSSAIFYNISDDVIIAYLPETISNDQLYQLELFTDLLEEVNYMEIKKITEKEEDFYLHNNIATRFSNEVIQSYYKEKQKHI